MPGFTDIGLIIIDLLFQGAGVLDTVYGHATTNTRLQSEAADHIAWERYASYATSGDDNSALASLLSRIQFSKLKSPIPLHAINKAVSSPGETLHGGVEIGVSGADEDDAAEAVLGFGFKPLCAEGEGVQSKRKCAFAIQEGFE